MKISPIALFTYNRPDHTEKTLQALLNNNFSESSDLFIFSDYQKNDSDELLVKKVRNILRKIRGFRSVEIIERTDNFGLAKNIINGVTDVLNIRGAAIILEDDLITSKNFLAFMNKALNYYEKDDRIASIHGYTPPLKKEISNHFFLRGADCWGWATWSRAWSLLNHNGSELLQKLKEQELTKKFDFDDSYPFTQMLIDQINKKNDSWAIRWYASNFLANKLTLYPKRSYIHNIGNDGSGSHCALSTIFDVDLNSVNQEEVMFEGIPVEHSTIAFDAFKDFYLSMNMRKKGFLEKLFKKLIAIY